jgi:hypothetical protein
VTSVWRLQQRGGAQYTTKHRTGVDMSADVHQIAIEDRVAQAEPVQGHYASPAVGRSQRQARRVVRYLLRQAMTLAAVGLTVLVIGEVWLSMPAAPKSIAYVFDEELGHRYAPNQMPSPRPLGLFAIEAPPMVIDAEGFRNGEVDWTRPVVLALGSSEVVGPGVAETDIWTARLSGLLSRDSGMPVTVYNAGTAAYGPYHSSVVLRRIVEELGRKPALVIVRVSLADREFVPWTREQLSQERVNKERRDFIKRYSVFVPFLLAKAQLQVNSIRAAVTSLFSRSTTAAPANNQADMAESMWAGNRDYWQQMAALGRDHRIPILFVVSDPYGTEGGARLFRALSEALAQEACASVWLMDHEAFGLTDSHVSERQQAFARRLTLGYDPHANALQHRIIAQELFTHLKSRSMDLSQPPRCARASAP